MLSLAASASTWFYVNRILKPAQVADAAAHHRPRGNLSDLYPRWLGARELLLHGRNPYTHEITIEIQRGYYGRALDAALPDDPTDEQGFAYPVYVVFLLAPTVTLHFDVVQTGFRWLLIALAGASVLLWLRVLRWRISCWPIGMTVVLVLGSLPMVQGIKLQQLSLLVAGLLAGAGACLAGECLFSAGVLLALATVKPQLAWPLVLWLLVWAMSEWRLRRRFVLAFGMTMAMLLAGAELLLPGWLRMFAGALADYHRYTHNQSILGELCGPVMGRVLEGLAVLGCAFYIWPVRHKAASSEDFGRAFALVLALTVLVVPMYAPYNQVLLLPAVLSLVWAAGLRDSISGMARMARVIGGLLLAWPWIATLGLTATYFWLSAELRQGVLMLPFYTNFALPVFIFGLALLESRSRRDATLRVSESTE